MQVAKTRSGVTETLRPLQQLLHFLGRMARQRVVSCALTGLDFRRAPQDILPHRIGRFSEDGEQKVLQRDRAGSQLDQLGISGATCIARS